MSASGLSDTQRRLRHAFLRACAWDVAVRKPGNVSLASPGHRMQAEMFLDSAQSCVDALVQSGTRVGQRIEAAIAATWARVGCNTNLGIVLLCAPIASAFERAAALPGRASAGVSVADLRWAWQDVMAGLTVDDARRAFRAIAMASPGGLGRVETDDVRSEPSRDLRAAMSLAARRDRVAAQYCDAGAELFDVGLVALDAAPAEVLETVWGGQDPTTLGARPDLALAVQRIYLAFLSSAPDSHIVRKHGTTLAQTVMSQARPWSDRAAQGQPLANQPEFIVWDESLKRAGINPGTCADLTVATLMLGALRTLPTPLGKIPVEDNERWHGT